MFRVPRQNDFLRGISVNAPDHSEVLDPIAADVHGDESDGGPGRCRTVTDRITVVDRLPLPVVQFSADKSTA